jgi:ankyrin repeat protein
VASESRIARTLIFIAAALLIGALPATAQGRTDKKQLAQEVCTLAAKGEPEPIKQLVSADKDLVNAKDGFGDLALNAAIRFRRDETARFLVENGADFAMTGARGYTPLHEAVDAGSREIVRLLLERGADPSSKGESHAPPLHLLKGDAEIARLLIENGADVNRKGIGENTALHWCAERGADDVSALLIRLGANPNSRNELGETPLHYALSYKRARQVRLLVDAGADLTGSRKWPSLHYAAAGGDADLVSWVISEGVDINEQGPRGCTALHVAVSLYGKDNAIEVLVANGARLDLKNQEGLMPLEVAKRRGFISRHVMEMLEGGTKDKSSQQSGRKNSP